MARPYKLHPIKVCLRMIVGVHHHCHHHHYSEDHSNVANSPEFVAGNPRLPSEEVIVNVEAHQEDAPAVMVDPQLAAQLKLHQITGVRFLWKRMCAESGKNGCILAHSMGLGEWTCTSVKIYDLTVSRQDPSSYNLFAHASTSDPRATRIRARPIASTLEGIVIENDIVESAPSRALALSYNGDR